tara:strand:- start:84 stop:452 length:369 start_codon:yes stop_codon:yes gene_type:complete
MSIKLNELKKELKKLDKEYKNYLNSAKIFKGKNKKMILSYISLMEKKIKNVKIEINTEEAFIKIVENAKKEKAALKRKANNAFNTPKKGPAPKKNKQIFSPLNFEKNMQNLQRGLFLTPTKK